MNKLNKSSKDRVMLQVTEDYKVFISCQMSFQLECTCMVNEGYSDYS
jgi:hypothetical protein